MRTSAVEALDSRIVEAFRYAGASACLATRSIASFFRRPFEAAPILEQMESLGLKSLTIVCLTSLFTGMVFCLQTGSAFVRFGAKSYVAKVIAIAITRELGPILVSLIVSGRAAAGIAAEIGSMKVSDQIDAIRVMGASPVKRLVMPRIIALIIMLPLLALIGDVLGIFGGMIVASIELDIKASYFISSSLDSLTVEDVLSGIGKCFFFGLIIAGIGCYQGLTTAGGTRGVGISTTKAVVLSSILILLSDLLLTKTFMLL
ncbi:MAG: ABC transporter permease [Candidatus Coatesbacteria bacterium]|nr:ABC transporter permease [Candidatus Coatesbacteria bacterium]